MKKFVGEVLGLLVKFALFFLIVGVILGFILGVRAHADVALTTGTVDILLPIAKLQLPICG